VQQEYRHAVDDAVKLCRDRFKDGLLAAYWGGSAAFDEGCPPESDVSLFAFTASEPAEGDASWAADARAKLGGRHPISKHHRLILFSVSLLRTENWLMKFILRYNAVRVDGRDLLAEFESEGITIQRPSPQVAKGRIPWVRQCVDGLEGGVLPDVLFKEMMPSDLSEIPPDNFHATRKLARNFVVLEGAYVLMAAGRFRTFRQRDVLSDLRGFYAQWNDFLDRTERILAGPHAAGISPLRFAKDALPFAKWSVQQMEKA